MPLVRRKIFKFVTVLEPFRFYALSCLSKLIDRMSHTMLENANNLIAVLHNLFKCKHYKGLFLLFNDQSARIRQLVCQDLGTMVELHLDILLPHIRNILLSLVHATQV